ncbi:MAG: ABC transporter ATP-binding protein [Synergistaceae bacterium]|jgi:sn-glycerol 3-phosphate transport system ATP-binding protein|nr:ABC transporter ATP-binding protein [Synergistaceae bacterium]
MISLKGLKKTYPNGFTAIDNLNLDIQDGSFTVLVGPSGCGKTTFLRMIAGCEECTEGEIFIRGRNITKKAPGDRGVAMVFQNYALYPHMTVEKNISFGLKNYGYGREEIRAILRDVLELVGLLDYAKSKPSSLSGGQRQRVALARAISKSPEVFLMDEPLSNLDARLRVQMRGELIRIHQKIGSTTIYITHDQVEAMTMGDCIAVMNEGAIMQCGSPDEVYNNPANIFTARFIGDPGMNIVAWRDGVSLGFRSSKALLQRPSQFAGLTLNAAVRTREHLGEVYRYTLATARGEEIEIRNDYLLETGRHLAIYIRGENLYAFGADSGRIPTAGLVDDAEI